MVYVVIALPVKSLTAAEFRALFELPFTQAVAKVVNVSAQHLEVHQFADGARVVLIHLTVSAPASKCPRRRAPSHQSPARFFKHVQPHVCVAAQFCLLGRDRDPCWSVGDGA